MYNSGSEDFYFKVKKEICGWVSETKMNDGSFKFVLWGHIARMTTEQNPALFYNKILGVFPLSERAKDYINSEAFQNYLASEELTLFQHEY